MRRQTYLLILLFCLLILAVQQSKQSDVTIFDYIPDELFSYKKSTSADKNEYPQENTIVTRPRNTVTERVVTEPYETEIPQTETEEIYTDERIPNFVRTKSPEYKDISVTWDSLNFSGTSTLTLHIDKYMYEYYRSLERYTDFKDYLNYINDENNREILKSIADTLNDNGKEHGYSSSDIAREAICFVQAIPYSLDSESTGKKEFQKYPLETIYDNCGDCEDSSLLLVGILRELNFGTILLQYEGHIAVGIKGDDNMNGTYYEYNGSKYYYVETTNSGWYVGDMPDDVKGQTAEILEVK